MPYEEKKGKKIEKSNYKDKAGISKEDPVPHVDLSKTAKSYRSK